MEKVMSTFEELQFTRKELIALKSEHEKMVEKIRNLHDSYNVNGNFFSNNIRNVFPEIFAPEPVKAKDTICEVKPPDPQGVISVIGFPTENDRIAVSIAIGELLKDGWKFSGITERGIELRREWHYPKKDGHLVIEESR